MIVKGNQRGGGSQLAVHLMNSFDNEVIEVAEVRGSVARDLSGAFAEWRAQSLSTRCEKYLYSLSLSPDQAQGRLTREQYLDLIARTERSLKLVGQPRVVVFHEKRDERGDLRQHTHVVWSRIDIEKNKAVQMSHDRLKLRSVAQEFARDHGIQLPNGMKNDGSRDRFNRHAKQENLAERQQKERTGVGKAELMAEITGCWASSKDGAGFVGALEAKGYTLARGERHGKEGYALVDLYGEIHSLSRHVENATAKEIRARLQSSHPLENLPAVEDARAAAKQQLEQIRARINDAHKEQKQSPLDDRREALAARQQQHRADLDKQRLDLHCRQFRERAALRDMQADDHAGVAAERLQKQPKGVRAFLTRITGISVFVAWAQNKADQKREAEHKVQTEALLRRHGSELKEMDRHYTALGRLDKRENHSASTAVLREGYRKLRVRAFDLKPEFEKALARQEPAGAAGDGGGQAVGLFNRLAAGIGLTKGDLQAAFERATAGKTVRKEDAGTNGPAPADPEKLERARQLRDQLNSATPKARDRDRER
jgi:hypothetical protein